MSENDRIIQVNIDKEMRKSYIDYSMSVIVSRALPDVRDGMKPVHRRVLFGMKELGMASNRAYKKSARIVGEVLGKYHPHGDSSVYMAMVRMAQPWSLRYTLVDGQGNFGSVDGDSPAAMRYTEVRLTKIAEEMMQDIDKETVDFQLNFDDTLEEPKVLPTRIPNLLINGASGIAVGMATNMPPHNLTEVINATIAYIENRDIDVDGLMEYVKAPDFPTAGIIYGYEGVKEAFRTGRGRIVVRARTHVETKASGRELIIVTEIPYQVNKKELIERVAELVNEKKIEGIVHANDESDRTGMRIVFALRRDADAQIEINKLYKMTDLQTSFSVNNVCLVDGRPRLLNLRDLIHYFVKHRHEVIIRRTKFDLKEAQKRIHILEGLLIALDNLDAVIKLIRNAKSPDIAREGLIENFGLSEIQARAILDMRLQRLTGLEQDKIREEHAEVMKQIAWFNEILGSETIQYQIIKDELIAIRDQYGDERKTEIIYAANEFNPEDFYSNDPVVITISHLGYIKRILLKEFKIQARGGKGSRAGNTREEDFLEHMYVATMHNWMLFFTEKGKCFWMKVYDIPEGSKTSKGRAIQNMINLDPDDKIRAYMNVETLDKEEYIKNNYIVLVTKRGIIKKTSLEAYSRPRANGINAVTVREGDSLLDARLTSGKDEIVIAARSGKAIRFNESKVRPMGRNATGVKAIKIEETDEVVSIVVCNDPLMDLLCVSAKGFGKRTSIEDYRVTNRGGKGVRAMMITDKTGDLVALKGVTQKDDLMIITATGITIRMSVNSMRTIGRATQGVRLITLKGAEMIADVCQIDHELIEEDEVLVEIPENAEVLNDVLPEEPITEDDEVEEESETPDEKEEGTKEEDTKE